MTESRMESIGNMYVLPPNTSGISSRFVASNRQTNFVQSQPATDFANSPPNATTTAPRPNASASANRSPVSEVASQMNDMNVELGEPGERKLAQIFANFMLQCGTQQTGMERLRDRCRDGDVPLEAAQSQLAMLDEYYKRIMNKSQMIDSIEEMPERYLNMYQDYMFGIDDQYMAIKTEITTYINRLKRSQQSTVNSATGMRNPLDDLSLQRIRIERFSGDYKKWPNFKSKFEQFFHNNTGITDAAKFFRLDDHLEHDSEAYQLIAGFERVGENYQLAWQQLCTTYDNKRKLVDETIGNFVDIPKMPSATRGNLMVIINAVNHLTKSLVRYEVHVEHWDPIIVNLLLRKLDKETQARWSHERPQRKIAELKPLMDFLENRAESMEGGVTVPSTVARPGQSSNRQNEQRLNQPNEQGAVGGTDQRNRAREVKCSMCGAEHQLFNCQTFRKLPLDERWKRVRQFRVCENCLRPKCTADRCKLGPCKVCGHKHNGLLCGKANAPTVAATTGSSAGPY